MTSALVQVDEDQIFQQNHHDPQRCGDGGRKEKLAPAKPRRPASGTQVYGLEELDGMQPVFRDIYAAARSQDLPLETLISEYAPGQYELEVIDPRVAPAFYRFVVTKAGAQQGG